MEIMGDLEGKVGANRHAFRHGETDRRLCHKMYEESEDCCA